MPENMVSKTVQRAGKAGALGIGFGFAMDALNVFSAKAVFDQSIEEGNHIGVSLIKGAGSFVISEAFYGGIATQYGIAGGFAGAAVGMAISTGANLVAKNMENTGAIIGQAYRNASGIGSGHFDMTQAGYTMRQRSLNAIRSNGANINSAFGNEARNYYLGL